MDGTARPESPGEVMELRKCTYAGRPFGREPFVREMEERFQRKVAPAGKKESGIQEIRIKWNIGCPRSRLVM